MNTIVKMRNKNVFVINKLKPSQSALFFNQIVEVIYWFLQSSSCNHTTNINVSHSLSFTGLGSLDEMISNLVDRHILVEWGSSKIVASSLDYHRLGFFLGELSSYVPFDVFCFLPWPTYKLNRGIVHIVTEPFVVDAFGNA